VQKHSRVSKKEEELHLKEERFQEENVKEILHDVLNELYYSKGKKERHGNITIDGNKINRYYLRVCYSQA
jgi:predicted transposase YbfD/YdcC